MSKGHGTKVSAVAPSKTGGGAYDAIVKTLTETHKVDPRALAQVLRQIWRGETPNYDGIPEKAIPHIHELAHILVTAEAARHPVGLVQLTMIVDLWAKGELNITEALDPETGLLVHTRDGYAHIKRLIDVYRAGPGERDALETLGGDVAYKEFLLKGIRSSEKGNADEIAVRTGEKVSETVAGGVRAYLELYDLWKLHFIKDDYEATKFGDKDGIIERALEESAKRNFGSVPGADGDASSTTD